MKASKTVKRETITIKFSPEKVNILFKRRFTCILLVPGIRQNNFEAMQDTTKVKRDLNDAYDNTGMLCIIIII
jgi:hypothetical protein